MRQQWPHKFASALDSLDAEETFQGGYRTAYMLIQEFLIESLEPGQRRIHEYVAECGGEHSAADIDVATGMSYRYVATILKQLVDLKLLKRRMLLGDTTRYYVYWKP